MFVWFVSEERPASVGYKAPSTEFPGYRAAGTAGIGMKDCEHGGERQWPSHGRKTDDSPVGVKGVTGDRGRRLVRCERGSVS